MQTWPTTKTIPNVYVGSTDAYARQPFDFGSFLRSACLSQGHGVLNFLGNSSKINLQALNLLSDTIPLVRLEVSKILLI
jgi:hypothetical protein